jgi:hypothetical protein
LREGRLRPFRRVAAQQIDARALFHTLTV